MTATTMAMNGLFQSKNAYIGLSKYIDTPQFMAKYSMFIINIRMKCLITNGIVFKRVNSNKRMKSGTKCGPVNAIIYKSVTRYFFILGQIKAQNNIVIISSMISDN